MIILEFSLIINIILFNEILRYNRFSIIINLEKMKKRGVKETQGFKRSVYTSEICLFRKLPVEHEEIANNTI